MPRICQFTGRKTSSGFTYTHRGRAKYLGGVGTKVTGKTKRTFKPNIQTVSAVVDGTVQRIKVSTKAMRMGLVIKPLKRKFAYHLQKADPTAVEAVEGSPTESPPTGGDET